MPFIAIMDSDSPDDDSTILFEGIVDEVPAHGDLITMQRTPIEVEHWRVLERRLQLTGDRAWILLVAKTSLGDDEHEGEYQHLHVCDQCREENRN